MNSEEIISFSNGRSSEEFCGFSIINIGKYSQKTRIMIKAIQVNM